MKFGVFAPLTPLSLNGWEGLFERESLETVKVIAVQDLTLTCKRAARPPTIGCTLLLRGGGSTNEQNGVEPCSTASPCNWLQTPSAPAELLPTVNRHPANMSKTYFIQRRGYILLTCWLFLNLRRTRFVNVRLAGEMFAGLFCVGGRAANSVF